MGTNFYLGKDGSDGSIHIGKRSAAGAYCWDCSVTLCKNGDEGIHESCKIHNYKEACRCGWFEKCPKCGKEPIKEGFGDSTGGRELGFNKNKPQRKTGVASCSSFSWAILPYEYDASDKPIFDEYDREYTREEFAQMLLECPVEYFHSIGVEFS